MNLSKLKRQEMLDFLEILRKEHTDDESMRAINEIENALTEKKYGLVWEEHSEKVDEMLEHNIPILVEQEDKKIVSDIEKPFNFLLEGDNLHSLKLLEKTHKGAIDVIYIDPPYNTGNKDFMYNDQFIDKKDGYSHSKWLSFMSERLELSRKLLSEDGVIFVSIGDDELCQLKLLMDETYGEQNAINIISVKTKNAAGASGGGEDKKLKKNVEYLLIYTKNCDHIKQFNTVYKQTEIQELLDYYKQNSKSWKYTTVLYDQGEKKYIGSTVDGTGEEIKIYKRINYETKSVNAIAKEEGITVREVYNKYFNSIFMTAMPQSSIRTRVVDFIGLENLNKDSLYSIEYVPKSGRNKGELYEQFYKGKKARLMAWFSDVGIKDDSGVYKKDIEGTLWSGIEYNNLNKEGNVNLDNGKKPISLLTRIIEMIPNSNITVLDFFAGSGTTGHAVAALNKEDGGNRKYILCTNNENNICEEVTYKRIKNIQEELPHNLKYMKTDFISKMADDDISIKEKMIENIIPLIELEHGVEVDGVKNIIILEEEKVKDILVNALNDVNVYIDSGILLSQEEKTLASQKNITIIEIPEYYYRNELREVGEI